MRFTPPARWRLQRWRGSRGSDGRASSFAVIAGCSSRPAGAIASGRAVRHGGEHGVREGFRLLRASAEQVLDHSARDRIDAGAITAAPVPRPAALWNWIDGPGENPFRHGSSGAVRVRSDRAGAVARFDFAMLPKIP